MIGFGAADFFESNLFAFSSTEIELWRELAGADILPTESRVDVVRGDIDDVDDTGEVCDVVVVDVVCIFVSDAGKDDFSEATVISDVVVVVIFSVSVSDKVVLAKGGKCCFEMGGGEIIGIAGLVGTESVTNGKFLTGEAHDEILGDGIEAIAKGPTVFAEF